MDLQGLSEADRAIMMKLLEEKQIKDSLRMYNSLVERCFGDCVSDFTTSSLNSKEEGCLNRCCDKFFKLSARVGLRFAENNALPLLQNEKK